MMDARERVHLKAELKKQYEQICATEFWKDFMARLEDERKSASRHCETDEDVAKWQGFIRGIETIKGLPAEVIGVASRKFQ
jgi:hypothetical protein